MTSMVEQTISLFDERARNRERAPEAVLPPQLRHVLADARAMDLVLSNLIDNAVKYSGENP